MKILMICMGNICRSPMAEVILKQKLAMLDIDAVVESAGIISFHEGEGADKRAEETVRKHNLTLESHSARGIKLTDLQTFDKIYVMDSNNYQSLQMLAGNNFDNSKVDYLLNEVYPGQNREVPDPYYGGKDGFEKVFQMIYGACEAIARRLKIEQSL